MWEAGVVCDKLGYEWFNEVGWVGGKWDQDGLEKFGLGWVCLDWVWWGLEVNIEGYGMLAI